MISLLLILFACSSESEPITLDINQPIQLIVAQKVENNTLSESAQQFITDESDISNILSIINEIDYESYNHDNLPSKLEDYSYYSLAFFKKNDISSLQQGLFSLFIFEDGEIIVIDIPKEQTYSNNEKSGKVIKEIKNASEINF